MSALLPAKSAALHRLVLAVGASAALLTLAWAGLKVRELQGEAHRLRQELDAARAAAPSLEHKARADELDRLLAEVAAGKQTDSSASAAREKELHGIIDFLRKENTAAQQTIERLSKLEPANDAEQVTAKKNGRKGP